MRYEEDAVDECTMGAPVSSRTTELTFSVVIPNFNYAGFVGEAISSALALDWPEPIEVIVVDDASTDDSRAVIDSFGDKIIAICFEQNRGQREACNAGFARSTGDVVIFLDSDDLLLPQAPGRIAEVWRSGLSKVQYRLQRVDAEGHDFGSFPELRRTPTSSDIATWYFATAAYPTPPGSGNAFSRAFLERIMPLGPEPDPRFTDSALLAAAPLFGDVLVINEPLAQYRYHGSNDSALSHDPSRLAREVERGVGRADYAAKLAGRPVAANRRALRRSREMLSFRAAAYRETGYVNADLGDTWRQLVADALQSPLAPGPESGPRRMLLAAWLLGVLLLPGVLGATLVRLRFRSPDLRHHSPLWRAVQWVRRRLSGSGVGHLTRP